MHRRVGVGTNEILKRHACRPTCYMFVAIGYRQQKGYLGHLLVQEGRGRGPTPQHQSWSGHDKPRHGRRGHYLRGRDQLRFFARRAHAHRVDDHRTVGYLLREVSNLDSITCCGFNSMLGAVLGQIAS